MVLRAREIFTREEDSELHTSITRYIHTKEAVNLLHAVITPSDLNTSYEKIIKVYKRIFTKN